MNVKSAAQAFPARVALILTCWLAAVAVPVKSGVTSALPVGKVTRSPAQIRRLPATVHVSVDGLGKLHVAGTFDRMCGSGAEFGGVAPTWIR